ncbi:MULTISPECIES: YhdH/YhfP family quinone oxidoreductase [unclassified Marinobacter]|uniref:YhdH/YhfP family quinone oxidoreductase n=1 Tax=unclassified Marinobacter TaxID=83889 RepID=UPI000BF4C77F|nr:MULTISPECIES: YhdH/YhfP family quinone oxidoreductase [unclassified Marinobacter]PFG08874.1 putative YhdH/YhfP family quinone oxidoreductase [Marinobacter sp. LV10MA510-1]PFG54740.1 putative YhdH/YhfP family quinone oxidoreductase [Marinobacter sp. LV10R520-4]
MSESQSNPQQNGQTYQAWQVSEQDGGYRGSEMTLSTADLPAGDVLIRVSHSSLNYKDALSASGNKGVTRQFPHTPGIDAAGEVVELAAGAPAGVLGVGSQVLVTGYDLGMNTAGGFGEYIRVPAAWCIAMPEGWAAKTAMTYGTAGLTAGLCVHKLLTMGAAPEQGKVAVSGASGAVGSVAVEILSVLGFDVVAISGKAEQEDTLRTLGAAEIVGREALEAQKKPMLKPAFANAVDSVGGAPLAELLKQVQPGGSVSCCGLVAGIELPTTVLPFILRGVNLLGVDSVEIPLADKQAIWDKLAGPWGCPQTEKSARVIGRSGLASALEAFLAGKSSGKIVLQHGLN